MAGDIDGIGDVVTGTLAAGALSRGGRRSGARHSAEADIEHGLCLNCGARLVGDYCQSCGQSAHIHRSMGAFFHDLLHGVLHFEGKTWRTLPLLAWRPGELTRRYIHGERAQFVSPLALFLFAVFLLFGIASFAGGDPDLSGAGTDIKRNMVGEVQSLNAKIADLESQIASGELDRTQLSDARADLAEAEQTQTAVMAGYRALTGKTELAAEDLGKREDQFSDFMRGVEEGYADAARDERPISQRPVINVSNDEMKNLDGSWLGQVFVKGIQKARANPALVFYKVKTNAYKFGWALIPLSVPFVWLVMVGPRMRQWHIYDHVIFTTYSIGFMLLLGIVLIVCGMVGVPAGWLALIAIIYPPFHMYRQLRGAYRLGRINAAVRMVLLLFFSVVALSLFVSLLVAAGIVV